MAKAQTKTTRKKTAKRREQTTDYVTRTVKVGKLTIEMKCRVRGLQYLEEAYNTNVSEIPFNSGRVSDMAKLLVALIISTYPDMSIEEAEKEVGNFDMDDMNKVLSNTDDLFRVQSKN